MSTRKIVVDISQCGYYDELHETIKQTLDFPKHYGKNLDALWDCLQDIFVKEQFWEISISGIKRMNKELQPYMQEVLKVFAQAERKFSNVKIFLTNEE